jgi:excinuclease ABC subunit A
VNGGLIVAEGTPEQVANEPKSFTGQYLKPMLARAPKVELASFPAKAGVQSPKGKTRKSKKAEADQSDLLAAK